MSKLGLADSVMVRTHLEIIDEICNRKAACNDSKGEKSMLERAHVWATTMLVFSFEIIRLIALR